MSETSTFAIRTMSPDDLDQALGLSMKEGWNQTMRDWKLLLDSPDNICLVAEKDNRVAGTATALNHENKIAWIGMVLVDKSLRGLGAGKMLLENIIGRLKHLESVKLDATPAGEPLYRKLGFIEEHRIFRMTCDARKRQSEKISYKGLHRITEDNIPEVLNLDRAIFGADRSYQLMKVFNENPGRAFCIKIKNSPYGFAFGRDGSRFSYIGPVSALTLDSAIHLIAKTLELLNNQSIAIDVLEDKKDLIDWLESTGFVKQRHFIRMYLKNNPYPGIVHNQYLISGPEYG
jgi:GNAT superfamily N-acetyltransferase